MAEDYLVVGELPGGLTIVSVLPSVASQPVYQVRDGSAVLVEYPTLAEIFDYLSSRD